MKKTGRVSGVLVAAALFGVAAAGPAQAAPDWLAPAPFGPAASNQTRDRIGFDSTGRETDAHLAVTTTPVVTTSITLESRLPGEPFATEATVNSTPNRLPISATIAVAPSGAAVACIQDFIGPDPVNAPIVGYRAIYRAAGSNTWSSPVAVSDSAVIDNSFPDCVSTIGANGAAAAIAQTTASTGPSDSEPKIKNVVALVRDADGGWGSPTVLSGSGRLGEDPQAKMDDSGNLTVVWRERWQGNATATDADDLSTMKLTTRMAGNGIFGSTTDLTGGETAGKNVYLINFASNQNGRAVVCWEDGTTGDLVGATRVDSAASFGSAQPLDTAGLNTAPGAAGVSPDGTAYIGYWNQNAVSNTAGMIRQPLGGGWTTHQPVGPAGVNSAFGGIQFLGNDAHFVTGTYIPGSPDTGVFFAVRWRKDQPSADAFRDLVTPGSESVDLAQFLSDGQGGLVALWDRIVLPGSTAYVAYDGSPPRNTSLTVPATATVGAATSMSTEFADLWSSVGQTTWDFGDGGTGTGDSVSHAWAEPGDYTVTVTGTDARGNTKAVTASVKVTYNMNPPPGDFVRPKVTLSKPACGKKKKGKACKKFQGSLKAWKVLKGTASDETGGSGLAKVEVAVSRKNGKKFDVLKGKAFKKRQSAKVASSTYVRAKVKGGNWSLKLPKSSRPGTYTFRVRATDKAGNVSGVVTKKVKLK